MNARTGERVNVTLFVVVSSAALLAHAAAQSLPTAPPPYLAIVTEQVAPGHGPAWARLAAERRAVAERGGIAATTLALRATTGVDEAWFISPAGSSAEIGERAARRPGTADAGALDRVESAMAAHLSARRTVLARARPDLSRGAYPDLATQRVWEISVFRVQAGNDDAVAAAFASYAAAADRAKLGLAWRVYEVVAGMPGPAFLVFSSFPTHAGLDTMAAEDHAIVPSFTAENGVAFNRLQKALVSGEVNRYRLDPALSTVPAQVRALDPAFWGR
jgi:hypothetical protein